MCGIKNLPIIDANYMNYINIRKYIPEKLIVAGAAWAVTFFKRMTIHSLLAIAGMAGPVALVIADMAAAFSNTEYSLVRDSISSLALTPLGWFQTIGFLSIGILVEAFVAGLLFNIKPARRFYLGIGVFVFVGFGMLLIGAFHTDPVGAERTTEGILHSIAATGVFWFFPIAVLLLMPSLKWDSYWKSIYTYSLAAGIFGLALAIVILFLSDEMSWFGLYERILVANMVAWVEVAAIKLLILSVSRKRQAAQVSEAPTPLPDSE